MFTFPMTMMSGDTFTNELSATFNGVDEFLEAPDDASLDITDELSIFAWIKTSSTSVSLSVVSKYVSSSSDRSYFLGMEAGKVRVITSGDGIAFKDYLTFATFNDNAWHLIGTTFSGGVLKIYVDGVELSVTKRADPVFTTLYSSAAGLNISGINNGTIFEWDGLIDEPAIWGTTVLTAAEVLALYNGGTPINLNKDSGNYTSSGNLVSWYRFDGDTAPTVLDRAGSNDLTMTNMDNTNLVSDVPT